MALDIAGDEDAFETVAITWSQPEAAVMLSMFEFYGIPAFVLGRLHASVYPTHLIAFQGIQVRVHHLAVDDALDLLAEVAERPAAVRPYLFGSPFVYPTIVMLAFVTALLGYANWEDPGPLALVAIWPLSILLSGIPPTRTASTFMLWKRSREVRASK
jgi:hypothetical protein